MRRVFSSLALLACVPQPALGADYQFLAAPSALDWQPFTVWNGLMVVQAQIDGHSFPAMIDTGASISILLEDEPGKLLGQAGSAEAIGGSVATRIGSYGRLQIGGASILHGPLGHVPADKLKRAPFRLIIGADVIRHYALQVDWAQRHLRFLAARDVPESRTAWAVSDDPLPGRPISIRTTLSLCGRDLPAMLDTGSEDNLYMAESLLPAVPCSSQLDSNDISEGAGGSASHRLAAYADLRIGGQALGALPVSLEDGAKLPSFLATMAAIGNRLLRRFNYTLDVSSGQLILWGPGDPGAASISTTGIVARRTDAEHVRVEAIMKGSPAAGTALRAGDMICAVDREAVSRLTPAEGHALAAPAVGVTVTYGLCDGRAIRLTARDFTGEIAAIAALQAPPVTPPTAALTERLVRCVRDLTPGCQVMLNLNHAVAASAPPAARANTLWPDDKGSGQGSKPFAALPFAPVKP